MWGDEGLGVTVLHGGYWRTCPGFSDRSAHWVCNMGVQHCTIARSQAGLPLGALVDVLSNEAELAYSVASSPVKQARTRAVKRRRGGCL